MNKDEKQDLVHNMSQFYIILQREVLDLIAESNNSELSPLLFNALHEIYLDEYIIPSVLSKRLSITIPNTSRCLHSLTKMGYVIKVKDKVDKRITHIELSLKGIDLAQNSFNYMDKSMLKKVEVLNSGELAKISESFLILMSLFKNRIKE
ncbi:MarR family winged helix-turn-helix transcriptional regulator [Clostridium estertheticum]|uniref:MarR family winged helix-turn-helix transcriptional regulator n=1 Tax=Clostridium estertheticum TaxID=238834 RepID=UPI001C7D68A9|nr:helix-turn-helix domain-containing protein [Clostridium estertheticum]MBX4264987.1 MarR family winged helix-turn-helix transcriptional regulator [Clostridium estertheticum]MBX4270435.1 MarR family winged helix-turn-helix transcriptional regulator [Clostridium estertheticum]WLC81317.1 MarR family winged helix-turn-helix transcriptional regulator [Clostridium estertheticum]WLC88455.1 MarR family winged helix-turn-helix transcriptional regulator [Clostridium estertheticum]